MEDTVVRVEASAAMSTNTPTIVGTATYQAVAIWNDHHPDPWLSSQTPGPPIAETAAAQSHPDECATPRIQHAPCPGDGECADHRPRDDHPHRPRRHGVDDPSGVWICTVVTSVLVRNTARSTTTRLPSHDPTKITHGFRGLSPSTIPPGRRRRCRQTANNSHAARPANAGALRSAICNVDVPRSPPRPSCHDEVRTSPDRQGHASGARRTKPMASRR